MSDEKQDSEQLTPVFNPAPEIESPETEEGQEFQRDVHTRPGSKFRGSPPAEVVPPGKRSGVYS